MTDAAEKPPARLRTQVLQLAMGSSVATATTILFAPVLSRLFDPSHYGIAGLAATFAAFASVALAMGFPPAIVQETSVDAAAETTRASIMSAGVLCVPVAALLITLAATDTGGYQNLGVAGIALAVLASWLTASVRLLRAFNAHIQRFDVVATGTVSFSWTRVLSRLVSGSIIPGGVTLIVTAVLASSVRFGVLLRTAWRPLARVRETTDVRGVYRRHRDFTLHVYPAWILSELRQVILLPAITALYGLEMAGIYALVSRLIGIPIGLLAQSLSDVVHRRAASLDSSTAQRTLVMRIVRPLAAVAALGILLSIVFWRFKIGETVLGAKWVDADVFILALAPGLAARLITRPIINVIAVAGETRGWLYADIAQLAATVALIAVAAVGDLTVIGFMWGLSVVRVLGYALYGEVLRRALQDSPSPLADG